MFSFKRVLALSGMAGMLAALAMAIPAQAATAVKMVCAVAGSAKTNPPVKLVGGTGSYTFDGLTLACVSVENSSNPVVVVGKAQSTGTYTNSVCGTGSATSPVGGSSPVGTPMVEGLGSTADYSAKIRALGYTVVFTATVGVLSYTGGDIKKTLTGNVGGPVQLLPPDPAVGKPPGVPASGDCTKAFDVAGAITLSGTA
jgi:hypothetical protein